MSEATEHRLVYVTTPSKEEAVRLGRLVVDARLAACANVLPSMTSVYWWEGKVTTGEEAVLLLKTRAALVDRIAATIAAEHGYECPCVVAVPLVGGHRPFLDWIDQETRPPGAGPA